jgi:hypothetical protein
MFTRPLARLIAAFLATFASAHAATFVVGTQVDSTDAAPGDGICADAEGACSLRAAIIETNALVGTDTIEIPAGVYAFEIVGADEDGAASGDLNIDDDLVLRGAGSDATFIDAAALDRVIEILGGAAPRSVRIEGLTLRNGFLLGGGLEGGGAGLRVASGVALALDDVVVRDNRSTQSFGAVAIDSQGCIEGVHVRVLDNRDTKETGSSSAIATVRNYEVDGNVDRSACLVLEDSEISGNLADIAGAIEAEYAPTTLRRTLVSDNEARASGAMLFNLAADALLENVTLSGNRGNPGAILNDGGSHLTLVNSTVTGNGPASNGGATVGGIQDVHGGFGFTVLANTILSGNGPGFIADDCERASSLGGNIVGDSARCHFDAGTSDQLDADPALAPLADNGGFTRTHLAGAAALDRGTAENCPATDQRGIERPLDGDADGVAACDVGAVELGVERDAIFFSGFDA